MPNNKDYINSYLKENKDKFPKEALVEELKKAGYGEVEINEEVGRVYGKNMLINLVGLFLILFTSFIVYIRFNHLIPISLQQSAIIPILGLAFFSLLLLWSITLIYYFSVKVAYLLQNKNKKTSIKIFVVYMIMLIIIIIWFYLNEVLLENNDTPRAVTSFANLAFGFFILLFYLFIIFITTKIIFKKQIINKLKIILIYIFVLICFTLFLKVIDITLSYVSIKTSVGNYQKIECLNSGGRWSFCGSTRMYMCLHRCPFNRDEDGNCINKNLASDPSCYVAPNTKKFNEIGFEYAVELGYSCSSCFVD